MQGQNGLPHTAKPSCGCAQTRRSQTGLSDKSAS